ncbi:MAG: hypothetical protein COU47_00870 [Candidatus Niyogibacteria bacterium CG10_big_fil_rev_8_21_14_0_10_46_36]|uniref:Sulfotransferase domain-containing protein n=1 Tax=Candidatus Niyogibacteria bacterium CG10_big_fil_rev_8_21_14_0_10_46_36 TaxID=1974726 RepID=A0A2H0TEK2_9BACT|nr:MAG: hypothetical protein COU47_00870 [Candidatus Niyogibacteria bacterium CG10_big_fil_rev_8_21_14_0_10_46_36]
MTRDPIIFLHIVKGGGVTFQRVIARAFPERAAVRTKLLEDGTMWGFSGLSQQEKDSIKFLWGHIPFGAHTYFSRPVNYVTMLREPISRVVSFYYAAQEKKASPYKADQMAKDISLREFIESDVAMVSNFQTRMIAGEDIMGYAKAVPIDARALETAKKNIDEHIVFSGVVEQFDESLLLLKKALGIRRVYYARANENKAPRYSKERTRIPESLIVRIKEKNQLDIQLYHYVRERFEREKKAYGSEFTRDLARFKKWNKWYQALRLNKAETTLQKIFNL